MLDRIGHQDYSESVSQKGGVDKVENRTMSNPYAKAEKGVFIDEFCISDAAFKMYEREKDVQKFSSLVLSDQDDTSSNALMVQKTFGGEISIDDDEAVFSLLDNEAFLNDVEF